VNLSIIIPTLNEIDYLHETISHTFNAAHDPDNLEIIVVDSRSSDGTVESVNSLKCKTYCQPEFIHKKYENLNFGLAKSLGNTILFLDADTLLPEKFDLLVEEILQDSKVVGGAFEFDFREQGFLLWIIRTVNRIRYRMDQSYFGDQAVFCQKSIASKVGGFPEKALMESAYFCKELQKEGKLRLIKQPIKTSPRRFLEHGTLKVMWFDVRMWIRFLLGMDVQKFGEKYWRQEH